MNDTNPDVPTTEDDEICINGYPEHDEDVHYEGEDGVGWTCRRCGAEGWDPADKDEEA
ncbi:hypothetical protein [Verrucosispora sp. NA02020]|uniref:hypothetical protein n=1 Tax=Verrucosispora sp. NA02020 TaxID=2742132 RepID=UPI0015925C56|nr:hypothetical protein [Verrucosispora sp. NA02020]QKW15418.1 hypothetical protein HUT12_23400 [Verrucosispora sp. NA02020]